MEITAAGATWALRKIHVRCVWRAQRTRSDSWRHEDDTRRCDADSFPPDLDQTAATPRLSVM